MCKNILETWCMCDFFTQSRKCLIEVHDILFHLLFWFCICRLRKNLTNEMCIKSETENLSSSRVKENNFRQCTHPNQLQQFPTSWNSTNFNFLSLGNATRLNIIPPEINIFLNCHLHSFSIVLRLITHKIAKSLYDNDSFFILITEYSQQSRKKLV